MNLFEQATREKVRWSYHGTLSVEDLWDLGVKALDTIYKELRRQVRDQGEDSLLDTKTAEDDELNLKIEIVKYIVAVKQAEAQERKDAAAKRERKQRVLEVIAKKQDDALLDMSVEDLQKMVDEL